MNTAHIEVERDTKSGRVFQGKVQFKAEIWDDYTDTISTSFLAEPDFLDRPAHEVANRVWNQNIDEVTDILHAAIVNGSPVQVNGVDVSLSDLEALREKETEMSASM